MHVLMIPSFYPSAAAPFGGVFFRELAQALRDAGYQMGVVAPGQYSVLAFPQRFRQRSRMAFEYDEGIPTYSSNTCAWFPKVPYANTLSWLKYGMRLVERYLAEQGRPDLVHAHAIFQAGILAERVKRRWGIPYVTTSHGSPMLEGRVPRWQIPMLRRALARSTARTAVSPRLGEAMERRFDNAATPWTWVPNMVATRFFEVPLDARAKPSGPYRFLHVSLLEPIKALDDLLRAFAAQFKGAGDVELRIGGEGPVRSALQRLAAELGLADQVRFLGTLSRDEVAHEMMGADAFVLCSRFETFSLVLAEALACGTPVISTACGGPECIVNEFNGLLVAPGNAAALGQAMTVMRERRGRYDAETLRRDCASRFGREAVIAQWRRIYDQASTAGA